MFAKPAARRCSSKPRLWGRYYFDSAISAGSFSQPHSVMGPRSHGGFIGDPQVARSLSESNCRIPVGAHAHSRDPGQSAPRLRLDI